MHVQRDCLHVVVLAAVWFFSAPALAESPVIDQGLNVVSTAGLAELKSKVSGRNDLVGDASFNEIVRYDTREDGSYFFSLADHPAHPFAMYCGDEEAGALEVRAWTAGDEAAGEALKFSLTTALSQAGTCEIETA